MTSKPFLKAEWRKLIMANYSVSPELLSHYLPSKTELDFWENKCYISLVGFMFKQVRVKGIRIPFHINFPEVNLRFYVRYRENGEWKRGVVFIKEIVPKRAITFIANTLYNENYSTMPMQSLWLDEGSAQTISYKWKKKGEWNNLEVNADADSEPLIEGSKQEFITEHFWGYSSINKFTTAEYHVVHPRWNIYRVNQHLIDCDFPGTYGKEFAFLQLQKPDSVFLAEGSGVSVFSKRVL